MLWILADLIQESVAIAGTEVLEVVPAIVPSQIAGCSSPWQGVICYRGDIVPVMDLCERYGMPTPRPSMRQRILIMSPYENFKMALKVPSVRAATDEELQSIREAIQKPIIRQLPGTEIFSEPYFRIAQSMLIGVRS